MSNRLKLNHLTFVGQDIEPAGIEFGPKLTVIVGPSDTGKSYVLDSIDFMLGAKELREINELEGYSHVLLGITIGESDILTLQRHIAGGKTYLHDGDVRTLPVKPPHRVLNATHNSKNERNLSNFLLTEIGLSGQQVRKNARNTTRSLSFRDMAHLCVISETNIQSDQSPILTSGVPSNETAEKSILKLLLEGEDDSGLDESASDAEKKISRGKLAMLEKVIAELTKEMEELPDHTTEQIQRLEESILVSSSMMASSLNIRDSAYSRRRERASEIIQQEDRIVELNELGARFGILLTQYESDLSRLEMVHEGGTLLTLLKPDVCILCGASKEHQNHESKESLGIEDLGLAVASEIRKTESLYLDLQATLVTMSEEKNAIQLKINDLKSELESIDSEISKLDRILEPQKENLLELTSIKSKIEQTQAAQEQIRKIEQLRGSIVLDENATANSSSFVIDDLAQSDLSHSIEEILISWHMPDALDVRIDEKAELLTGGRRRSSRGKGTRALLHAAFTLGLAEYCIDKNAEHPGFVVLDSPLVTYRQPDPEDKEIPESVADSFYKYLAFDFSGQSIVLENQDPPSDLTDITIINFTKRTGLGRYGLFPTV